MKISSMNAISAGLLLQPLAVMALGPSSCKEQTDVLEACAETAIGGAGVTDDDVLGSCTDERSELSECLGAATPDEPLTGNLTLPPSGGLLACYVYLTFYDACVAVTNTTTGTDCPLSCIIDGPDQTCDDYDIVYCERQKCCTDCLEYMTEYDTCVANAGSCSVSNPNCSAGSARFSVSVLGLMMTAFFGGWAVFV